MGLKLFRTTGFATLPVGAAPTGQSAVRPPVLLVLASIWIASVCNLALWREFTRLPELANTRGVLFAVALGVVIAATTCALLSLFAWRWTMKPVISLFLLAAAFGSYFMMAYGVVIDPTMMVNVLQTDPRETRDLLNWRMGLSVLLLAVLPMLWLWRQPMPRIGVFKRLFWNATILIASCVVLAGTLAVSYKDISSVMRSHTQLRYLINPLNSFYALGVIAAKPWQLNTKVLLPVGEDARLGARYAEQPKPPLLLLVLGETARSGNFAINGYARPTTPQLARANVVSLRNVWSCGTSTAASVPCMFSHLGREAFEARRNNYENMLEVLERSGLAVLWINNQTGCKGVCERTPNVTTPRADLPGLCAGGECFDEIMLKGLNARIAAMPAERRARGVVLVMHQMGSHGPAYYKRSPPAFKAFMPECTSNALQACPQEQVLNAYDNTILYTDHFLGLAINWLQVQEPQFATAMLYVSDHGESLGENNLYLHGLPYAIAPDVQKRVPWITWLSASFEQRTGVRAACLKQQLDTRYSHDNYFHSVLGLMDVQTRIYQRSLDVYAPCAGL